MDELARAPCCLDFGQMAKGDAIAAYKDLISLIKLSKRHKMIVTRTSGALVGGVAEAPRWLTIVLVKILEVHT